MLTRARHIHPDLLLIPGQIEPCRGPIALLIDMVNSLELKAGIEMTGPTKP
jgi:hypothetical protein